MHGLALIRDTSNETYLSAFKNTPRAYPWFFGSHENQRRACSHQCTPSQRAQTVSCLTLMPHQGESLGDKTGVKKITLRSDFDVVMSAGVVASTAHFALHVQRPAPQNRIGAVVPKRWAKQAVTRNAIKRQIYGLAQAQAVQTPAADMVVRLRKTFQRTQFVSATSQALKSAVRSELKELFDKLSQTL